MCKRLTSVKFPAGLQSIGDRAFMHCESLKSIELPVSVTYIGDKAFSTCYKLKQISIPDSITYIGEEALDNKEELKIIYSGTRAEFYAIPKKLYFGRCALICPKDPKTLIGRIGNIFLVSLYAAMIIAAVIVGFTVKGSLPWVISIPASISVNILFAFLDKKIEAFDEAGLFWASVIELVACAALVIFGNVSPWMLACYAGVSIGIVVANAFAIKLLNESFPVSCIFLGVGGIFISFGIMFWPSLLGIALSVIGAVAIIVGCFYATS